MTAGFPAKEDLTVCFAHAAYRLNERLAARHTGLKAFQVESVEALHERVGEADVVLASGLWRNTVIPLAKRLRFIQSVSAGTDQYDKPALRAAGIRLASAQGVNERAVADHAMGLLLALTRQLHLGRDNQHARHWRGMISEIPKREDELDGKTMLIVGMGRIGAQLARRAHGFGMTVVGTRRDAGGAPGEADRIVAHASWREALPEADVVVLTCPLTPETERMVDAAALAAMKPSAYFVNVARGRCADEPALIAALEAGRIAGAGIDVTVEEPLPPDSPLWSLPNALVTPHTAGETQRYEDNVLDLLLANLDRLWRGEADLVNQVV